MALSSILENFKNKRIIVVGDIMLDRYLIGTVSRISPEAPVPILKAVEERISLGGAANVANNLKSLGARVEIFGVVGRDADGEILLKQLNQSNLSPKNIIIDPKRPTTTKTRLITKNQQVARIDKETEENVSHSIHRRLITSIQRSINSRPPDGMIISDYAKGLINREFCRELIALARSKGIFLAADPKGKEFTKYKGANVVTPNQSEAEEVCGFKIDDDKSAKRALRLIAKKTSSNAVIVTRGRDGISYYVTDGEGGTIKSFAKEVYDVTGAGDTVVSVLTLSFLASNSWEDSVRIANQAAGIVVGKLGTAYVTQIELLENLNNRKEKTVEKIISRKDLPLVLSKLRKNVKKIAFTNGCFDLFHRGHLHLLKEAKKFGDILIVGINSDRSTRRLKGKERPFISQSDRARIIAELDCVDHVVIFDEDTPLELIKEIKPDVLIKGSDYTVDQIVGKDIVESYGGKVQIVKLIVGYSTSMLVNKVKKFQS